MSDGTTNGTTATGTAESTDIAPKRTALTLFVREQDRGDLYWDPAAFEHGQRVAAMLASSHLLPEHLQGKDKIGAIVTVLAIARRTGEDPLTMLQSLYVVHGRPGWSAAYIIARAKRAGMPIRWRVERLEPPTLAVGPKKMPNLRVTAYSTLNGEPEPVEYGVTSEQAIAAGWAKNEQYIHSAELMLRYRSATHLVRLYAPDVLLGLPTEDEVQTIRAEDVVDVTPIPAAGPGRGMAGLAAALEPTQGRESGAAPQEAAPAAGAQGSATEPAAGNPASTTTTKTKPARSTETDAAALHAKIRERLADGVTLWPDEVKTAFNVAVGIRSHTLPVLRAALDHGVAHGWWTVTTSKKDGTDEVTGYGVGPVAAERKPDRWDALDSREALGVAIDEVGIRIGQTGSEDAYQRAGLTEDAAVHASVEQLREIGRAFDSVEAEFRAAAKGE